MLTAIDYHGLLGADGCGLIGLGGEHWVGDQNVYFGKNVQLSGKVALPATLIHSGFKQSAMGCAFQLNDGAYVHDVILECRTIRGQQNQVIGFQGDYSGKTVCPSKAIAHLESVWGRGHTFCLYAWGGTGNVIYAKNCRFDAAQFGVFGGGGSGVDAQFIYLDDCIINVKPDEFGMGAGGDQGLNACGVACQGGSLVMNGGMIHVVGSVDSERAIGIWSTKFAPKGHLDEKAWPYPFPSMTFNNVSVKVEPGLCKGLVADVVGWVGPNIIINGGSGSGPNGKWNTVGNVTVNP